MTVEQIGKQIDWNPETGNGSAEASSLGWRPGEWPRSFTADTPSGNPFAFTRLTRIMEGGEFYGWEYYSYAADRIVHVYND